MRRLRDRLNKLENGTAAELSQSDRMLLVTILAKRDCLFWPWRFQSTNRVPHCEIRHRQTEYLAGQVGIAARADGRDNWKDASAARRRLISAGLVFATHSSGQVTSLFLSMKGEAYARKLVGSRLMTYEDSKPVLAYLRILADESGCTAVRESTLLNVPSFGNPEDWNDRTELMLPLLSCGAVVAQPDTVGRILYCYRDIPAPPTVVVDVESDADFDDNYVSVFNGERQVLASVEPRDGNEIVIPIPASVLWPTNDVKETEA